MKNELNKLPTQEDLKNLEYWVRPAGRRRWDEWGSPVGLGLAWALFIVPLGVFLVLLHLAGLLN